VFAVDGNEPAAASSLCGESKLACGDKAFLVRKREIDAALEGPERRGQSREAHDRVQDEVRFGPLEQLGEIPARLVSGARPSIGCEPDAAAQSSKPGCASMISSACCPIEPVAPRSRDPFHHAGSVGSPR